jgi:hypothetical protein
VTARAAAARAKSLPATKLRLTSDPVGMLQIAALVP